MNKISAFEMIMLYARLRLAPLYLSAGMPRSGSTLLFNVLRLCLEYKHSTGLSAGWINDLRSLPRGNAYLLKVHRVTPELRMRSRTIFYTFRDVRDAMVSAKRKFDVEPSIEQCRAYIREQESMTQAAHVQFQYEYFVEDLSSTVRRVAYALKLQVSTQDIIDRLPQADASLNNTRSYDKTTLLHGNHATNTKPGDWRDQLEEDLQCQIRQEFGGWLTKHGYPLH